MFSRSFLFTVKACGLIVLIAAGLLFGPAGLGPGEQSAEAALLSEVKKLLASDAQSGDLLGWSVAVSGDTAVVGARFEDAEGSNAGAAYVFDLLQPKPTPTPTPTATAVATPPGTAHLGPTATVAAIVLPQTGAGSDGSGGAALLPSLGAGVVAGALALGGAAWYARRGARR